MEMEMNDKDNGTQKKAFYVVNKGRDEDAKHPVLNFLFNTETGEICGRTVMSWIKITVFYIIFYICLGIFSLAMFALFWKLSIVDTQPRWIGAESLIGTTPGVGFRPMPDQDKNAESTLIWINRKNDMTESYWADRLDEFFSKYYNGTQTLKECTYENQLVANDTACDVNIQSFAECQPGSGFGYTGGKGDACVLIKLNRIYDWLPESYTAQDKLPETMPDALKDRIKELTAESPEAKTMWITCEPENVVDNEHAGPIEYHNPGSKETRFGMIPNYYYPFKKQAGYESPFIFVRFPELKPHVLIQIECRAWAKNMQYNRQFRIGSTHFELMVD